jgi:type I pantothenate kinase
MSQASAQEPEANGSLSPFRHFTAEEWGRLRQDTPLPLSAAELEELKGFGERISLDEVSEIFLPLSRLLNLYVGEMQELYRVTSDFLGRVQDKVPYIIGVAGSVAVGKSTTARILRTLLARWPNHPKVDLITTDGFLYPNKVLDVKAGVPHVEAPVYSHFTYDILPGEAISVDQPDILIVEGLNVLQPWKPAEGDEPQPFVSDFFDFSIYLDADEAAIRRWYIERFLSLRRTSFKDPAAYFHRYSKLSEEEAVETADSIWTSINLANLHRNVLPTRQRADLILRKGDDHRIRDVYLRKL